MILVTGGTGLVGSHLLYQLVLENECVFAIYRKNSDLNTVKKVFGYYTSDFNDLFQKIKWIEADITDVVALETAFEKITTVYHCAAMISFNPKDYRAMRKINIDGTSNIVNLCIDKNVKKLCFVSSIAAIGKANGANLMDESCEWNIENSNYGYAITKYGAEMEVWRASQENVKVIIVNPGVILGSGFWNAGPGAIFNKVYKGLKFYTEGVTGYVSVRDVVKSMMLLMNSSIKNERYILVSENLSYNEVFSAIANNFKISPPKIKISTLITAIIWRFESLKTFLLGKQPLLTKQTAKSIHSKRYYSSEKIKKELGFKFEPIKTTISTTCKDYLSEQH
jgi:nucleoside-diphosphate-sugar epimerase